MNSPLSPMEGPEKAKKGKRSTASHTLRLLLELLLDAVGDQGSRAHHLSKVVLKAKDMYQQARVHQQAASTAAIAEPRKLTLILQDCR